MPSLNERAWELCDAMIADADSLGVAVGTLDCGTRIIDCGVKSPGSIEAGRRLAQICMAGLGDVRIIPESGGISNGAGSWFDPAPLYLGLGTKFIFVTTNEPVPACMASQYAGWQVTSEKFFAMGSGPMRAAACREEVFKSIGYCEKAGKCVGVLETSKIPPDSVCVELAEKCGISPASLTLIVARTASPAGTVQIVARSIETALHKLHELGFDLSAVKQGMGWAPLPPIGSDDLIAIGWTNDAILYGAYVVLQVDADDATIQEFGPRVPSSASPDYGQPFAEIFKRYDNDFYRIDPMLFSPAQIAFAPHEFSVDQITFGTRHERNFGELAPEILIRSFSAKK